MDKKSWAKMGPDDATILIRLREAVALIGQIMAYAPGEVLEVLDTHVVKALGGTAVALGEAAALPADANRDQCAAVLKRRPEMILALFASAGHYSAIAYERGLQVQREGGGT